MKSYWEELPGGQDLQDCQSPAPSKTGGDFVMKGRINPQKNPNAAVKYWAANPIDRRDSFVGSGLPFPTSEIAYENTPNTGVVKAINSQYTINMWFPNCFYVDLGRTLLPPHVLIKVCDGSGSESDIEAIVVGDVPKHRLLTSPSDGYTRSSFKERSWDMKDLSRY